MSTEIIVALISSIFTLTGVIVTVVAGNKKSREQTQAQLKAQSDLTLYRLEQLEAKQDKHNTLIERMYKAEDKINLLDQRVDNLESKGA